VVEPFLWGLLPDNHEVLRRWGALFGVSPRHAFKLIAHVGEDCAGAVQFVAPERVETMAGSATGRQQLQWLTAAELEARIHVLLHDHSAARAGTDRGRFSLAGAQPKTALYHDPRSDRWAVPAGPTPTTHILKPATGRFDGQAENEHFCLRLARGLGLAAAESTVRYFGEVPVFVTERYDRIRIRNRVLRVHQEDACQALACMPQQKYQNEGGPAAKHVVDLVRLHSTSRDDDVARFVAAMLFHWLILGTDAHAKNWSLLLAGNRNVRLAPLYDVASALPYPQQLPPRRLNMAMKIGGEYRVRAIGGSSWRKAASEWRCDGEALRARMADLAIRMPDTAVSVGVQMQAEGIDHPVLQRLIAALVERAKQAEALAGRVWR
jgi:serine/threonine-protein kinase HipA